MNRLIAAFLFPLLTEGWKATRITTMTTHSFLTSGNFHKVRTYRDVAVVLKENGCGVYTIDPTGNFNQIGNACSPPGGSQLGDMEILAFQSILYIYITDWNNERFYVCKIDLNTKQSTDPNSIHTTEYSSQNLGNARAIAVDHKNLLLFLGHIGKVSMWNLATNPDVPAYTTFALLSSSNFQMWTPNAIAVGDAKLYLSAFAGTTPSFADMVSYTKTAITSVQSILTTGEVNSRGAFYLDDHVLVNNRLLRFSDLNQVSASFSSVVKDIRGVIRLGNTLILSASEYLKTNLYIYNIDTNSFSVLQCISETGATINEVSQPTGIWIRNDLLYVPRWFGRLEVFRLSNTQINVTAAYLLSSYPNYGEPPSAEPTTSTVTSSSTQISATTSSQRSSSTAEIASFSSITSLTSSIAIQPIVTGSYDAFYQTSSSSDLNGNETSTPTLGTTGTSSVVIGVIAGSVSGIFVVSIIAGMLYLQRRKRWRTYFDTFASTTAFTMFQRTSSSSVSNMTSREQPLTMVGSTTMFDHEIPLALPMYRVIQFRDIKLGSILQEGGFGVVYKGTLVSTPFTVDQDEVAEEVVIKIPKEEKMARRHRVAFDQEISILARFSSHANFVKFIGFCQSPTALILKYYPGRSLFELVHRQPPYSIPDSKWHPQLWKKLFADIVAAVAALHSVDIAHCDLKPGNILIESDKKNEFRCLLTDFGIARVTSEKLLGVQAFQASEINGASINYSPPEVLLRGGRKKNEVPLEEEINLKAADVYSLGATLSEIMVRKIPWHGLPVQQIMESVIKGERPYDELKNLNLSDPLVDQLVGLIRECYAHAYVHRPTAAEIGERLKE